MVKNLRTVLTECSRVRCSKQWLRGLCVGLLWTAGLHAGETPAVIMPAFEYPAALPELLLAANQAGLPVERLELPPERRPTVAGDSVTALISLRNGVDLQQWLLVVVAADLSEKESHLPLLEEYHAFSSIGSELRFGGRRAAIELHLIGPMRRNPTGAATPIPEVQHRRILVNAEYLEFGFDAACEAILCMRQENASGDVRRKLDYQRGKKPFPADVIQINQELATRIGLTTARERALVGAGLALPEFLKLIVRTPGLQDILQNVIEVSWWSVLTSGGETKLKFKHLSPYVRKLEQLPSDKGIQQYLFPFLLMLNDKPVMSCLLIVIEPLAPYAVTGGVLGIQAGRPYAKEPQLTVRLIAKRFGSPDRTGTAPSPALEDGRK